MSKKAISLLLVLCCLAGLSGCSGGRKDEKQPAPTLPPAAARYTAPEQDGIISESREYRIFLPGKDDLHLVSKSVQLEPADLNNTAEQLVRSLIGYPGDEETKKLGGTRPLDLYGSHPIEISGGVRSTASIS